MDKKAIAITFALLATASATVFIIRSKKANASPSKSRKENAQQVAPQPVTESSSLEPAAPQIQPALPAPSPFRSLRVIGDSQVERHLGNAARQAIPNVEVSHFGKSGYTVEKYLNDAASLNQALSQNADVFYIQLGDNGISNNKDNIRRFVNEIKSRHPQAIIIWGGPMKAVAPTVKSNYVNMTDTTSPRYITTYNNTRREWISRLRSALQGVDRVFFLDIYSLQEEQPLTSPFSDARKGDGVHLTEDSALELSRLINQKINQLFGMS